MSTIDSTRLRKPTKPRHSPRSTRRALQTLQELPDWRKQISNEYILTGYRRARPNWRECFTSVFAYFHNETINIHSHLWGAVLFCYILFNFPSAATLPNLPPSLTWTDTFFMSIFLLSATVCLSCSAVFHTVECHSKEVSTRFNILDYDGIVVLMVGTMYTYVYFGFSCNPNTMLCYLALLTTLGFYASKIVLNPEYAKPSHRGIRTAIFIGLGACSVMTLLHLMSIYEHEVVLVDMGFRWVLVSWTLYVSGGLIYANLIPERLWPGKFDYIFNSHQILHICVNIASLASYHAAQTGLKYRHSAQGQCLDV